MNLLIDTHVLIWWSMGGQNLGRRARSLISAQDNSVWVSAASIWEISIKTSLGRLDLSGVLAGTRIPEDLDLHGFLTLQINFLHALAVRDLPLHHRDPFDRMLVAQARCEDLTLLTADEIFAYDVRTIDAAR
jgi:PIN domain nuclease of toxin-antitoxin system